MYNKIFKTVDRYFFQFNIILHILKCLLDINGLCIQY